MRRNRSLRERRNHQLTRRRVLSVAERRRNTQQKLLKSRQKNIIVDNTKIMQEEKEAPLQLEVSENLHSQRRRIERDRLRKSRTTILRNTTKYKAKKYLLCPANKSSDFHFKDEYEYSTARQVNVCHAIESFGVGGAQTMMLELFNGLNKYYSEHINNHILCIHRKKQNSTNMMLKSYGVKIDWVDHEHLSKYLEERQIDVVLHHRIAVSKCLRRYIPEKIKYVLLNHTWNSLIKMDTFDDCDYYISVCKFLDKRYSWRDFIHPTRRLVILNGVENKYLKDIKPAELEGEFITGRCHRLVSNKFRTDSITWMFQKVIKSISGFSHYLIGTHKHAKVLADKYKWFHYMGSIVDRQKKMSIIKALNIYFYETFADEGASIAVLEGLAAGIPVVARPLGGTPELVTEGVNGFLPNDRSMSLLRLQQIAGNKKLLESLKEKTVDDFEKRLHVRHTANKYLQLFEHLLCK